MTDRARETKDSTASPTSEPNAEGAAPSALVHALPWLLPLGSIIAALATGAVYGVGTALLVLAGGVLLIVIMVLWASVRAFSGDSAITLEEAMALGAPTAAEEQKRAVLQALKDLEFEKSVGKIADADYEELVRRYRAEAKRLLRAVDEDLAPMRERANAYLAEQLGGEAPKRGKAGKKSGTRAVEGADTKADAKSDDAPQKLAKAAAHACPSCQTANDSDAAFCKKCGTKLADETKGARDAAG
jgi:hypothetical protein